MLFLAILAVLAGTAVALEVWFNLRQQLTPARVEEARTRWHEKGPTSYVLRYTVTRQSPNGDHLLARVQGGDVIVVEANGEPLEPDLYAFYDTPGLFAAVERDLAASPAVADRDIEWTSPASAAQSYDLTVRRGHVVRAAAEDGLLPPTLRRWYDMPTLLAGIARYLERDARAGGWRMFNVASFDPEDGRLLHYVRSSMRTRERVEFNLREFRPVADDTPAP